MHDHIPQIELNLVSTEMLLRPCPVCGVVDAQPRKLAGKNRPSWVTNKFTYSIWAWWMIHVKQQQVNGMIHDRCLPQGWDWWKIVTLPNINAYHSIEVEKELQQYGK